MSDGPTPEQAEHRLRRALQARAGDMAAGDGAPWDPHRQRLGILPFAAAAERRRGLRWRAVLGAVAALAIPVAGGAVLLADDDTSEKTTTPQLPPCAPLTATTGPLPPTTITIPEVDPTATTAGPPDPAGPTTTAPLPALRGATTTLIVDPSQNPGGGGAPTTTEPCEPMSEPTSDTTAAPIDVPLCDAVPLATGEIVEYSLSDQFGDGLRIGAVRTAELPAGGLDGLTPTPITAGPNEATLWTSAEGAVVVNLVVDDVTFTIQGRHDRDLQLAIAASVVRNDDSSFGFGVPCEAEETGRFPF